MPHRLPCWWCLAGIEAPHQRAPGDGRRDRRQDGVARRPRAKRFHESQEQRLAAAIAHRFQHGLGTGVVGLGGDSGKKRARALIDRDPAAIEGLIAGIQQAGVGKQIDEPGRAGERALHPLWTDDRRGGGNDGVRRIAGFARGFGRHQRGIADKIGFRGNCDVEHHAVIRTRDLMHQRQREIGFQRQDREIEHGVTMHARHLRLGVHDRRARLVLHVLARNDRANLAGEGLDLLVVGQDCFHRRQGEVRGQLDPLVVRNPGLERKAAARREIRPHIVELHHRR